MSDIHFSIVQPGDTDAFQRIAGWYLEEWKIPVGRTIERLQVITADPTQFQLMMTLDGVPIATAGLYHHVSLLDHAPHLKKFPHWLALVYTIPDQRKKGYGAILCSQIQQIAKAKGVDVIYLFTDTAERLYERLGWHETERIQYGERNVVVMSKKV
ncbi:MAG TPA: GNAT family N-acetyltransferase [Cyclobacteriaceae bacterium]|nr:GNAT family N-acetyltransferase [Cyclobacteriaceae bacterium]